MRLNASSMSFSNSASSTAMDSLTLLPSWGSTVDFIRQRSLSGTPDHVPRMEGRAPVRLRASRLAPGTVAGRWVPSLVGRCSRPPLLLGVAGAVKVVRPARHAGGAAHRRAAEPGAGWSAALGVVEVAIAAVAVIAGGRLGAALVAVVVPRVRLVRPPAASGPAGAPPTAGASVVRARRSGRSTSGSTWRSPRCRPRLVAWPTDGIGCRRRRDAVGRPPLPRPHRPPHLDALRVAHRPARHARRRQAARTRGAAA